MNEIEKTPEYFAWIGELKKRYRSTQIKASVSVNSALLEFYWLLGKDIGERYPASLVVVRHPAKAGGAASADSAS